jgi:hypothetical protein
MRYVNEHKRGRCSYRTWAGSFWPCKQVSGLLLDTATKRQLLAASVVVQRIGYTQPGFFRFQFALPRALPEPSSAVRTDSTGESQNKTIPDIGPLSLLRQSAGTTGAAKPAAYEKLCPPECIRPSGANIKNEISKSSPKRPQQAGACSLWKPQNRLAKKYNIKKHPPFIACMRLAGRGDAAFGGEQPCSQGARAVGHNPI